jgi:hypothetical protein
VMAPMGDADMETPCIGHMDNGHRTDPFFGSAARP